MLRGGENKSLGIRERSEFIVEAIVEIPVTDWPQAPFLVWLFFRTILNFLVERNKNFRPPSWFLAAILDLRARK